MADVQNPPAPPMTLRDWFAGQALPEALLSTEALVSGGKVALLNAPATAARAAYAIADAMLAARQEQSA